MDVNIVLERDINVNAMLVFLVDGNHLRMHQHCIHYESDLVSNEILDSLILRTFSTQIPLLL